MVELRHSVSLEMFFFQIVLPECLCSRLLCPAAGSCADHLSAGIARPAVGVNVHSSLPDCTRGIWLVDIWYVLDCILLLSIELAELWVNRIRTSTSSVSK